MKDWIEIMDLKREWLEESSKNLLKKLKSIL